MTDPSSTNQNPETNPRYKTLICKHFNTPQGCSYGDKCQFAHGESELKPFEGKILNQTQANSNKNKQTNVLNYKIVKCRNWEENGNCKYGGHCTFAHGDNELRNKADNLYSMQPPQMMFPLSPMMIDLMQNGQMPMMNMPGMDPNMFLGMNMGNMGNMGMMPGNVEKN